MARKPASETRRDREIVDEAKRRFERCQDWESTARSRMKEDIKFACGDAINGYQWPSNYSEARGDRPTLTINKTRQHNLQIINDARQNKPQIRVQPITDGADEDAAGIYEGIIRHIEYISDAQTAYDTATWWQVNGGIGYLRVVTDYISSDSFDQEIYIRRVPDPNTIYLDPDIVRYDGSDARFAFVFQDMARDEWDRKYPQYKGMAAFDGFDDKDDWSNRDNVRFAEYFRRSEKKDRLFEVPPELSATGTARASELDPEVVKLLDASGAKSRTIYEPEIEWFKIAGNSILERGIWEGKYIPIARVVGEETIINGTLDRFGHTRALIDPQRIYNFWSSAAVEFVALQTKAPWIAPIEAIEEYQGYWENANVENRSVLPYRSRGENNEPIPKPERPQPPVMAQAYMQGMQVAQQELMMASGQYQAEMGAPSNERSGVAINARQRQADNATYHYVDHLAQAIKYLGRIIIDLIPKKYDTARVLRIVGEDGTERSVQLDPNQPQAHQKVRVQPEYTGQQVVDALFNPNVGTYDVISDIGPAYATKRQEAFAGYLQIMQHNPDLINKAGDIFFAESDMPGADALADRLRKFLPPQILNEDGPDPQVAAMQQQMTQMMQAATQQHQQLMQQTQQLSQENQALKMRLGDKSADVQRQGFEAKTSATNDYMDHQIKLQQLELQRYQAETQRIAALGGIDPDSMKLVAREEVSQIIGAPALPLMAKHAEAEQAMAPPEAEQQAADAS